MPGFWIEVDYKKTATNIYESIWEEIEQAEKERDERIRRIEAKRMAGEERQRKKQAKKRKRMSQKQREAYDKKRAKKAAKRSKITTDDKPMHQEEIILLGPTWFPPGTPLKIDDE
jgi:FtsZ-interacting cell division protein YlmF